MRTQITETSIKLWLSKFDTSAWADKPGAVWPCSSLRDHQFFAEFDSNGLCRYQVDDHPLFVVGDSEVNAITSDFLRDKLAKDHPLYFITVGQFDEKDEVE